MEIFDQKIAVVTGAASGIGRATARALADAGCHIALVDVDADGLQEVKKRITSDKPATASRALCYEVAVSDAEAMEELAQDVVAEFGAAHIVVNNAGINVTARFEEHSLDDFKRTFDVNLWGVIHGCRAFLPYLRRVDQGHIVNISSAFGIVGVGGQSAYSASKFAVRGLSESLHEELAETSIGVSVVHPGCINTNILESASIRDQTIADDARAYFAQNGCAPEKVADRIVEAIKNKDHRVLVTAEAHVFDWLRRLLPTTGNRLANRAMARVLGVDIKALSEEEPQ